MIVELLELRVVCFSNIGKVFCVRVLYVARVCLALPIPQMIQIRSSQCELEIHILDFRHQALQIFELVDVGAPHVIEFARAYDSFGRIVPLFHECGNIRDIVAEYLDGRGLDLLATV